MDGTRVNGQQSRAADIGSVDDEVEALLADLEVTLAESRRLRELEHLRESERQVALRDAVLRIRATIEQMEREHEAALRRIEEEAEAELRRLGLAPDPTLGAP